MAVLEDELLVDIKEPTLPTVEELEKLKQDEINKNRELCQVYIRDQCHRGDSVIIYAKGSTSKDKNTTGEITKIGVQTIEVYDRINGRAVENVCFHLDMRLSGSDFSKNHFSFDHSEETRMIRRLSKKGASSVLEGFSNEIKRLEDAVEKHKDEVNIELAASKKLIMDVIKKVNEKTNKAAKPVKTTGS